MTTLDFSLYFNGLGLKIGTMTGEIGLLIDNSLTSFFSFS